MNRLSLTRIIFGLVVGVGFLVAVAAGVIAQGLKDAEARALEFRNRKVATTNPIFAGVPESSQSSIDLAIKNYGIEIPKNVKGPIFLPSLEDRGLTVRKGIASDATVYIGPEAFSSWGLLGSTLAHEVEIHCRQNFLAIHFQNILGVDGTGVAEREAYRYELANANRFGLSNYDRELIKSTMLYFYPEQQNTLAQRFAPIRLWLDRMSASSFARNLL